MHRAGYPEMKRAWLHGDFIKISTSVNALKAILKKFICVDIMPSFNTATTAIWAVSSIQHCADITVGCRFVGSWPSAILLAKFWILLLLVLRSYRGYHLLSRPEGKKWSKVRHTVAAWTRMIQGRTEMCLSKRQTGFFVASDDFWDGVDVRRCSDVQTQIVLHCNHHYLPGWALHSLSKSRMYNVFFRCTL